MKFEIIVPGTYRTVYQLEADSKEEAIELVATGEVDGQWDECSFEQDTDTNNWEVTPKTVNI